jgi:hypothetical protein
MGSVLQSRRGEKKNKAWGKVSVCVCIVFMPLGKRSGKICAVYQTNLKDGCQKQNHTQVRWRE